MQMLTKSTPLDRYDGFLLVYVVSDK